MKTRPDALVTAEKESRSANHENETGRPPYRRKRVRDRKTGKQDRTPSVPPKKGPGAQNMKTGPDAPGTAEKESGRAKHENGTTPSEPPKTSPRARNMKKGPDALSTVENESGGAKRENETRRPRYRRKLDRARKT
jgi:hypothetical protein